MSVYNRTFEFLVVAAAIALVLFEMRRCMS
jgi:hypothetical protein